MSQCLICHRLLGIHQDISLIHEFKNSFLVLGDHQYFPGYSVLLLKDHVREMHQLSLERQTELFAEVMVAGNAIQRAFQPWKMNYSCYGNAVEHVHWHIFPRYESDPDHRTHPWLRSDNFPKHVGSHEMRIANIAKIKAMLGDSPH